MSNEARLMMNIRANTPDENHIALNCKFLDMIGDVFAQTRTDTGRELDAAIRW